MKILIYSDVHISQDSSIVRGLKGKYSTRLHYIIKSLNWAEKLAEEQECGFILNLGDTFDKPFINAMEATAVQDIEWSTLPHYVLVGNHDSNVSSLEYSSVSVLKKLNFKIVDQPTSIDNSDINILLLPYITEYERKPIKEYWEKTSNKDKMENKKSVIFSHNDISGFRFGGFLSNEGFPLDDINKECNLFLNGHLHNSDYLDEKILNVGNLCGQNFSENASKYKHGAWILDTETLKLTFYKNPYALNFYKIQINRGEKINKYSFEPNSVLMIKCERSEVDKVKEDLKLLDIVSYRLLIFDDSLMEEAVQEINIRESIDYIKEFCTFVKSELGENDIVNEELAEISK